MTREIANTGQGGSAAGAGLEAGLVGVLLGGGIPLLLWVAGLEESMICLVALIAVLIWPATGGLAAYLMRSGRSLTRGRLATAGAVAGLLAGFGVAAAFVIFAIVLDPEVGGTVMAEGRSAGTVTAMSSCIFGIPTVILGSVFGAAGAVVTGGILRKRSSTGTKAVPSSRSSTSNHASEARPVAGPDPDAAPPELQSAIASLRAGDKAGARKALIRGLQSNPKSEPAWVWLAQVVEEPERKRECLQRALNINPDNATARQMLAEMDRPQPAAASSAASAPAGEKEEQSYLSWAGRRFGRRFVTRVVIFGVVLIVVSICSLLSQLAG